MQARRLEIRDWHILLAETEVGASLIFAGVTST